MKKTNIVLISLNVLAILLCGFTCVISDNKVIRIFESVLIVLNSALLGKNITDIISYKYFENVQNIIDDIVDNANEINQKLMEENTKLKKQNK